MFLVLKRLLVGRPLANAEQEHQRLITTTAPADKQPLTTRVGGEG